MTSPSTRENGAVCATAARSRNPPNAKNRKRGVSAGLGPPLLNSYADEARRLKVKEDSKREIARQTAFRALQKASFRAKQDGTGVVPD